MNIATTRISHDGVLLTLNPDTVVQPGFVDALVQPLMADPRLGSTSGTLVFSSNPSVVASAGIRIHRNGVALDARLGEPITTIPSRPQPVFGPSGGAAAYRIAAFRDVGGFCESFFLYLEDVDLAWRLRLHRWGSLAVPNAVAMHDYSSSSVEGSPFKRRLLARNRIWTLARCLPEAIWSRDRASILGFDLLAAGYGTIARDYASLQGRAAALAGLPMRLRERDAIHGNATASDAEIAEWIAPPVSPRQMLKLRRLTASLAHPAPR